MPVFFEDIDGGMNVYGVDEVLAFSAHFKDANDINCIYN